VGSDHVLSVTDVGQLNALSADSVFFVRRQSGWVNSETMVDILKLLAESLGEYTHGISSCFAWTRSVLTCT
jgi:hypothetical protein